MEEGLRSNWCVTEAPSCAVCVKASDSEVPQAKLAFSSAAGSGIRQAVCVCVHVEGCVRAAASEFVLGVHHHHITAHSSGVIFITIVWCFACCVMWVQQELWES